MTEVFVIEPVPVGVVKRHEFPSWTAVLEVLGVVACPQLEVTHSREDFIDVPPGDADKRHSFFDVVFILFTLQQVDFLAPLVSKIPRFINYNINHKMSLDISFFL